MHVLWLQQIQKSTWRYMGGVAEAATALHSQIHSLVAHWTIIPISACLNVSRTSDNEYSNRNGDRADIGNDHPGVQRS